jgi:hypothetical protein
MILQEPDLTLCDSYASDILLALQIELYYKTGAVTKAVPEVGNI